MDNFDWRDTVKLNLLLLRSVGLWPQEYEVYKLDLYSLYSALTTIGIVLGHNLSQIINIFYVYSNSEALSATVFVETVNILGLVKRYFFVRDLKSVKELFKDLNTYQFRPTTQIHTKLVKDSVRNWRQFYFWYSYAAYFDVAVFSAVPIVHGLTKVHKLPFEAWYPFSTNMSPIYEIVYFYQAFSMAYLTVAHVNLDTLTYAFMMFIGIQCDILRDKLKNLDDDGNFEQKLIKCITHHKKIVSDASFAEKTNNLFSLIILSQLAASTASLAVSMFHLSLEKNLSSSSALTHLFYLCGMTTQIFLYCWFGNKVEFKSSQIPYAVFESKWIGQSKKAIQVLIIFCLRCEKPIKITAVKFFTLSLQTFLSIIRTAWSYFAVLSTVNNK